ncbi:MAG: fused signal recognition particle receptor [Flavobacteriales bacterium]|jgi:fused signal recognition particle receptor
MFFKRKKSKPEDAVSSESSESNVTKTSNEAKASDEIQVSDVIQASSETQEVVVAEEPAPKSFFERIKAGLSRSSKPFTSGLSQLFLGKKEIDEDLLEELEELLLTADIGIDATEEIIENLTDKLKRKQLGDEATLKAELKAQLRALLKNVEEPLVIDRSKAPFVILVVGVNGVGKTTTIGKMAMQYKKQGLKVMLAAGDTFRAAAVEQLQVWGDRNGVPVVAQHTGADSASVIFDALESAKSRNVDVLIADTAGRLHNKTNLMQELEKVKRVLGRQDESAPHEVILVLDAGTGQNAVSQLDQFKKTANVSGLVLTKLDGTAKGGVIFALSKKHQVPVRFIGVGEGIEDLQVFDAEAFVDALFS